MSGSVGGGVMGCPSESTSCRRVLPEGSATPWLWAAVLTIAIPARAATRISDRPTIVHTFEPHSWPQNGSPVWSMPLPPPLLLVPPVAYVFRQALTAAS